MLTKFWEKAETKKQDKKYEAEFDAFLKEKYGKEYFNKVIKKHYNEVMSDDEIDKNIDEFEKYRKTKILKEKNLKYIKKELKNTLKQKVKTINLQKYKLKPKRAPVTVWLLNSNGKPDEMIDSKEIIEEEKENYNDNECTPKKRSLRSLFDQLDYYDKVTIDDIEYELEVDDDANSKILISFPINASKRRWWTTDADSYLALKLRKEVHEEIKKNLKELKRFQQKRKTKIKQNEYDWDIFLKEKYGERYNKVVRKINKKGASIEDFQDFDIFLERKYGFNPLEDNKFYAFLKEKYGKATFIIVAEAYQNGGFYNEDINEFEKYRSTIEKKLLKQKAEKEITKESKQIFKNTIPKKYKLKPKRGTARFWAV